MESLNLHIKILTSPTQFSIGQMIEAMKQVYTTAGINVIIVSTETLDISDPGIAILNDIDTGTCTSGNPSTEQITLSNYRKNANSRDVVVYMCRTVTFNSGSLNGCASFPQNKPMVVVSSIASLYTLGHEIGHVLGLSHVNDNDRLMTGRGTNNITNPPPDLIASEINRMIASNLTY